jgi:hypothetical protein
MGALKLPDFSYENLLKGKVEVRPSKEGKLLFENPESLIVDGKVVDEAAKSFLAKKLDYNQLDQATGELRGKGIGLAEGLLSEARGAPTKAKIVDYTKQELTNLLGSDIVKRAHEVGRLNFTPMTEAQFLDKANLSVYKSPSYGRNNPGSEYRLGVVDGEPVYMRSANHWGGFGTNVIHGTPADYALRQGLGVDPSLSGDQFGRIGRQLNQWNLPGHKPGETSYGYIPLSELSGVLPEKTFVSHLSDNYVDLPVIKMPNGNYRSRFAAFDPARRNEADIMGAVDYSLLPYLAGAGLLGAYGLDAMTDDK